MKQKVLISVGVLLVAVVIAQSVFLYRMSDKVNSLSQVPQVTSQVPDKPTNKPFRNKHPTFSWNDKDWNPFEEIQRMQNEMNRIFGNMRSDVYRTPGLDNIFKSFSFSPTLDMQEEDDKFIIKVDIPGSDASNINVKVEDQQLTISASTKKSSDDQDKGKVFRSERFMGQFQRSVMLPAPVLADKMKTDYKDGVLTITIPKA